MVEFPPLKYIHGLPTKGVDFVEILPRSLKKKLIQKFQQGGIISESSPYMAGVPL